MRELEEFRTLAAGGVRRALPLVVACVLAALLAAGAEAAGPSTTHTLAPAGPAGQNGWFRSPVEVRFAADPPHGPGVARIEYSVDGGVWGEYENPAAEQLILGKESDFTSNWSHLGTGFFSWIGNCADGAGCIRTTGGLGLLWYTPREYGDFHLKMQWRDSGVGNNGNSGVFMRFPDPLLPHAQKPQTYSYDWPGPVPAAQTYTGTYCGRSGPNSNGDSSNNRLWYTIYCGQEFQINDWFEQDSPGGNQKTGSLDLFKPLDSVQARVQPKGTWVEYEARVVGQWYEIYRNGELLNDFDNAEPAFPFRQPDPPTMARQFTSGFFGMQNGGSGHVIDFRNVRVTDLDAPDEPVVVSGDGIHLVEHRGVDTLGAVGEATAIPPIRIDTKPPVSTAWTSPATNSFGLAIQAADQGEPDDVSGLAHIEYSVSGPEGPWLQYGLPLIFTDPGQHTVHYRAVDVAGNIEEPHEVNFEVAEPSPAQLALQAVAKRIKLRLGKTGRIRVEAANAGDLPAGNVRLCISAPKKKLTLLAPRCQQLNSLAGHATSRTNFRFRIRPKSLRNKSRFNTYLKFTLSSPDGSASARTRLVAKR